jgi:hypothetical protein
VEVPIGKKIEIDRSIDDFEWFNINTNRRRGFNVSWDNNWDDSYSWDSNVEYVMTRDGLQRVGEPTEKELKEGKFKFKMDENGVIIEGEGELKDKDSDNYEYKGPGKKEKKDTVVVSSETSISKSETDDSVSSIILGSLPDNFRQITEADVSPLLILSTFLR